MIRQDLQDYCKSLEQNILDAYEQGVTITDAEKLGAKSLHVQLAISAELAVVDLNRRMRKRGLKAIKSAVRMEEIKKHDKKPTEGYLDDIVNLSELVSGEENGFDDAEVEKEELERLFGVFHEAHLYFRNLAKQQG